MKYREINKAELASSIWLFTVHSDNAEVIQFLKEKQIRVIIMILPILYMIIT